MATSVSQAVPTGISSIKDVLEKSRVEDAQTQRKNNEATDQIQQQLEELVRLQASTKEQFPAAAAEVRRALAGLQERDNQARKDSAQLAAQIRDSLVARLSELERRLERLTTEVQHSRNSVDDMSNALIERVRPYQQDTDHRVFRPYQ